MVRLCFVKIAKNAAKDKKGTAIFSAVPSQIESGNIIPEEDRIRW